MFYTAFLHSWPIRGTPMVESFRSRADFPRSAWKIAPPSVSSVPPAGGFRCCFSPPATRSATGSPAWGRLQPTLLNLSPDGRLRRIEECLHQGALPTKDKTAKALEPFAVRHRWRLVEPVRERFQVLGRDSALGSPLKKVAKHRFRNFSALYSWHSPVTASH